MKNQTAVYMLSTNFSEISGIGSNDDVIWSGMIGNAGSLKYNQIPNRVGGAETEFRVSSVGHETPIKQYSCYVVSEVSTDNEVGEVG